MLIKVELLDETKILINDDQICSIEKGPLNMAIITMSNGNIHRVKSPDFCGWENDVFIQ